MLIFAGLSTTGPAAVSYTRVGGSGNWSDLSRWKDNSSSTGGPDYSASTVFPAATNTVVINNNQAVTLDTSATIAKLQVVNNTNPGIVNVISSGTLTVPVIQVASGSTGTGVVNQSAGTVSFATNTVGNPTSAGTNGIYNLTGGTLSMGDALLVNKGGLVDVKGGTLSSVFSNKTLTISGLGTVRLSSGSINITGTLMNDSLDLNTGLFEVSGGMVNLDAQVKVGSNGGQNPAEFRVVGDGSSIIIDTLNCQTASATNGIFRFVFNTNGISTVHVTNRLDLSGVRLAVDGSAYSGTGGVYTLFDSVDLHSLAGITNISVAGFDPSLMTFLVQDQTDGRDWIQLAVLPENLHMPDAVVYLNYSAVIPESNAVPGGAVECSKISGPDWLSVSSSGTLSGVPAGGDFGLNIFTVQMSDGAGGTNQATMTINVIKHPKYPPFSWDTIPVYIHFGKSKAALTDAEVAFVAATSDFVCLEKGHARLQFGSTEAGISNDAARLKAANPGMKILYYWNSFLNYPFYSACSDAALHPEWILRNTNGVPVYKTDTTVEQYNILNESFRQWWAQQAGKGTAQYSCNGVFADAVMQPVRSVLLPYWAPATTSDLVNATCDQLDRAQVEMGTNAIVIYNGFRSLNGDTTSGLEYLPHADGVMVEHFTAFACTNKETIARDMDTISSVGKSGKMVIVKGWPDPDFTSLNTAKMAEPYENLCIEARNKIAFSLACYLVSAQPYSYFCYSWGYTENYGSLADFPEYRMPLGRPLGDAVRTGWVYTRSFEHLDVILDIEHRTASISGIGANYFNEWLTGQGLSSTNQNYSSDPDGDGKDNLLEYAFGTFANVGNPIPADREKFPNIANLSGTNAAGQGFEYIYRRRRDATARSLAYKVEAVTNLLSSGWSTSGIAETGTGIIDSSFENVTNRIQAGESGFVRLKISVGQQNN